jgi:hypothetical protein
MKEEVLDVVKFLSVPSAGVTATFAMVNQFLGTVAAILSIAFVIWKWRMDSKKYTMDQKQLDDMNNHAEEVMRMERKGYNKEKVYYEKNK